MKTVTTERMILRPFRDEDLDDYARVVADPEVTRYLSPGGEPFSREDAWRQMAMFTGHFLLRGYAPWAAELKDTGRVIGRIGLYYPEGWPGLEVGWAIGREHWGQGLAFEGARASLAYAWRELDADHVISVIHPDNARSIALAERLGETYEGRTRVRGIDVLVYGIDRPGA